MAVRDTIVNKFRPLPNYPKLIGMWQKALGQPKLDITVGIPPVYAPGNSARPMLHIPAYGKFPDSHPARYVPARAPEQFQRRAQLTPDQRKQVLKGIEQRMMATRRR